MWSNLIVYAFYERSKVILFITTTLFLAETVTGVTVIAVTASEQEFSLELGCVVTQVPRIFMAVW